MPTISRHGMILAQIPTGILSWIVLCESNPVRRASAPNPRSTGGYPNTGIHLAAVQSSVFSARPNLGDARQSRLALVDKTPQKPLNALLSNALRGGMGYW